LTLLDAALDWAAWGMPIIPVHGVRPDGCCTCGDPEHGPEHKSTGKHPALYRWYGEATTDADQIRDWWAKEPYYNIGGVPAKIGMIAIDADGDEGVSSMAEYERAHGDLPATLVTQSGSGTGLHAFFRVPVGGENPSRQSFLPHVDTRGIGGQIVLPPSRHRSGGIYTAVERPPMETLPQIPAALYGLIYAPKRHQRPLVAFAPEEVSDEERDAGIVWWRAQLEIAAHWIAGLSDGRHQAVRNKALYLASYLWLATELEEELFGALWEAVAETGGRDEQDTRNAILWGIEKGKDSPLPVSTKPDAIVADQVRVVSSTGKVRIPPTLGSAVKILSGDYRLSDAIRWDVLAQKPCVDGELLTDGTIDQVQYWLEDVYKVAIEPTTLRRAVYMVAQNNQFHPILEHVSSVQWDGQSRIERLFFDYFEPPPHLGLAEGTAPEPYSTQHLYSEYGRMFMLALVARCKMPGCKHDSMPILQGPGGIGKSTGLKVLAFGAVDGHSPWFSSTRLPVDDDKRKYALLLGHILIERAEFKPGDWETEKDFLAQTEDKFIPMFGTEPIYALRSACFCATSNAEAFIPKRDRRTWIVETASVNVDALIQDRDQLWAEALVRHEQGEAHYLTDAALETAQLADAGRFELTDDRTLDEMEKIVDWLDGLAPEVRSRLESEGVDLDELLRKDPRSKTDKTPVSRNHGGWGGAIDRNTRTARKAALRKLGWVEKSHPKRWVYATRIGVTANVTAPRSAVE
jgi:hypothetical protein